MMALTLHQPWATLIACGAKRVETRGWAPPNGFTGTLAIHAGKGPTSKPEWWRLFERCKREPFRSCLAAAGFEYPDQLPFSGVVAVATINRVSEMTPDSIRTLWEAKPNEYAFGDYAPGRFAWVLADAYTLPEIVVGPGRQKLWRLADRDARQVEAQVRVR